MSRESIAGFAALVEAAGSSSQLRILEANGCGIGPKGARALAVALFAGSSLEAVRMGNNCIGDEGVEHIGASLAAECALKELDISSNQVERAPVPTNSHWMAPSQRSFDPHCTLLTGAAE